MIVAVTQNTRESYLEFRRFDFKRNCKSMLLPLSLLLAAGVAFLFFVPAFGVALVLVTVAVLPCMWVVKTVSAKGFVKKNRAYFRTANKFEFGDQSLTVTSACADQKQAVKSEIAYASLYKVYETPAAFYLYLKASSCLLCPKADFVEGRPADCAALLAGALAKKFVRG